MSRRKKIMTVFGTRPEAIKLAPIIRALDAETARLDAVNLVSGHQATLVGRDPDRLEKLLDEAHREDSWISRIGAVRNPFGDGHSGQRIRTIIAGLLRVEEGHGDNQKAANG
jgi:UDP-N-acetylglucosamine 2-epimerase